MAYGYPKSWTFASYSSPTLTFTTPTPRANGDYLMLFIVSVGAFNTASPLPGGHPGAPVRLYRGGGISPGDGGLPGVGSGYVSAWVNNYDPNLDTAPLPGFFGQGHRHWGYSGITGQVRISPSRSIHSLAYVGRIVDGTEQSTYTFTYNREDGNPPDDANYDFYGFAIVLPGPDMRVYAPAFQGSSQIANVNDQASQDQNYTPLAGVFNNFQYGDDIFKSTSGQPTYNQLQGPTTSGVPSWGQQFLNNGFWMVIWMYAGSTAYGSPSNTYRSDNFMRPQMTSSTAVVVPTYVSGGSIPVGTAFRVTGTRLGLNYGIWGETYDNTETLAISVGTSPIGSTTAPNQTIRASLINVVSGQTHWNVYVAPVDPTIGSNHFNLFGSGNINRDGFFLQNPTPLPISTTFYDIPSVTTATRNPKDVDDQNQGARFLDRLVTKNGMYLSTHVRMDVTLPGDDPAHLNNAYNYSVTGPNVAFPAGNGDYGMIQSLFVRSPTDAATTRTTPFFIRIGPVITSQFMQAGMVG